jgi:hypothetical protein
VDDFGRGAVAGGGGSAMLYCHAGTGVNRRRARVSRLLSGVIRW